MNYEEITFGKAKLGIYKPHLSRNNPVMLIITGGGYSGLNLVETEKIAYAYMMRGYTAAILYYSCFPETKDNPPLVQASMALAYIRRNANELSINPDRIYALGLSAGGHLAGSLATLWHREDVIREAEIEYGENKPTAVVLCYPVISAEQIGKKPHLGSFHNLLCKKELDREDIDAWSIEKHVDEKSSPAFIIHAADDGIVPVENSIVMARAYADAGVQFEMHIYPHGPHGAVITYPNHYGFWAYEKYARWIEDSIYFLDHLK
jgi:acetyl esterase/lipase